MPVRDIFLQSPGTDEVTHTLVSVPSGIRVFADVSFIFYQHDNSNSTSYAYCGGDTTLVPPGSGDISDVEAFGKQRGGAVHDKVLTNTDAQVKTRQSRGGSSYFTMIQVHGWVDTLGRNGEA